MALLVINSEDYSERLKDFQITCNGCGGKRVTLDIDWAAYPSASWCKVTASCEDCHRDETVYESN
jgi:hypothetical protein